MRRAVGEQSRERHFIEPVKGGCMVRSYASFFIYANHVSRQRSDADTPQGQPGNSELRHRPECCFEPPHYRLQRKKSGVKAERVKTGPVCLQTREGARFSVAELRSRESDMRMVLGTFCHQKYHKFGKKANVSIGIDNQVVFLSSSLYTGCRIGSRRHRQAWVQLPKHYLVRECLLFPKIVIYRLLHFHSS